MPTYLEEVASRLIAFDTVSDRTNVPAVEYLADQFEPHGFRPTIQRYERAGVAKANLIAFAGPPLPDGLIISGHVDTVPFQGQPGWQRDPLRLELDGDRVYGRGTSDMKVFLAHCVDAAARLDRGRLARPLVFLFTADEEVGFFGAERATAALGDLLGEIPIPRQAWIGEPTGYEVFHTHKGIGYLTVTIRGRGGHSGLPEQGSNAIAVAGHVIAAIGRYQEEQRTNPSAAFAEVFPDAPYTALNFGIIRGGTAANMIAEECTITVSFRSLPDRDPLEVHRELAARVTAVEPRDYGSDRPATITLSEPFVAPPLLSPRGTPLEAALFEVLGRHESRGALFAADACRFAAAGIASLLCGPGDFEEAHQPNESIGREAFEKGTDVVLAVVERLCR
ncbi:MAG: M20 family metallopeptidase [Candidatus Binatia bacterium]